MSTSPDALVVGPMKAGTSWIHDYLESRGDVVPIRQGSCRLIISEDNDAPILRGT